MTQGLITDPATATTLPPFPALISEMDAGLMVNEDNRIWLVHDKPFHDYLHWVEFDSDLMKLTLVHRNGRVQDYGRKIHPNMADALRKTRQIFTMLLENDKVTDTYILPLLVRDLNPKEKTTKQKERV